ncbi:MAG: poly(A) polymerase, partial [Bdellovibrionales bacterium]|nr:poly(A) polymerase [Bdellovibrionales bacterium]
MPVKDKPNLHKDWIHPHAMRIVELLQHRKFMTYLVGGCVRDLLAGFPPKDFDIATSARPQQVKRTVPSAYIIGRRFRLVLVKEDDEQFEVATFRRSPTPDEEADEDLEGDNLFGSPEEDAKRRDFTMNGLFYDPIGDRVIDYVSGIDDVQNRIIRMIGEPEKRLLEDPVRIFRALRLSHKLSFSIEPSLREAMTKHSDKMILSVLPRRREEILKILRLDDPMLCLTEGYDLGVLQACFPTLHRALGNAETADLFRTHLNRMKDLLGSPATPTEVFLILIY